MSFLMETDFVNTFLPVEKSATSLYPHNYRSQICPIVDIIWLNLAAGKLL
jgi:hypothetical protein